MNNSVHTANLATLGAFAAIQAVSVLVIPGGSTALFDRALPVFYAVVFAAYIIFTGREKYPAPKADTALYAAGLITMSYLTSIFICGIAVGLQYNTMTDVLTNIWVYALPAVITEVLRHYIIRSSPRAHRVAMAFAVGLVFAFTQLNVLRGIPMASEERIIEIIFTAVLPALALNAALTYMAFESPLSVLLIVRCTFSLFPVLSPVIPKATDAVWACVNIALLFESVIIYYRNTRAGEGRFQSAAKKHMAKPSYYSHAVLGVAFVLYAAFALRAFKYFPVVVLTDSMTGTLDRGSVAIVKKLSEEDVEATLALGDVALLQSGRIEVVHRVIDVTENEDGEKIYTTQGDANPIPDSHPSKAGQIIGTTNAYIPYVGYPVVFLRSIFLQ